MLRNEGFGYGFGAGMAGAGLGYGAGMAAGGAGHYGGVGYGGMRGGFALIVVLFILLIIVGAAWL